MIEKPPIRSPDTAKHVQQTALAAGALLDGRSNATGTVTLAVSPATSTTLTDSRITPSSVLKLMPTTATAAAELATLYVACAVGSATVNHSASAAADRTYGYEIGGP